jgi:hypothetical protein
MAGGLGAPSVLWWGWARRSFVSHVQRTPDGSDEETITGDLNRAGATFDAQ